MAEERSQCTTDIKVKPAVPESKDQSDIINKHREIIKDKAGDSENMIFDIFTLEEYRDDWDELFRMRGLQISQKEDTGNQAKPDSYSSDHPKSDCIADKNIINHDAPKHTGICDTVNVTADNSQSHPQSVDGSDNLFPVIKISNNQDNKEFQETEIKKKTKSDYQYEKDTRTNTHNQRSALSFGKTSSRMTRPSTTSYMLKVSDPCAESSVAVKNSLESENFDTLTAHISHASTDTESDPSLETNGTTDFYNQLNYSLFEDTHVSWKNRDFGVIKSSSSQGGEGSPMSINNNSLEADGPTSCGNLSDTENNCSAHVCTGTDSNSLLTDNNSKESQQTTSITMNSNVPHLDYTEHWSSIIQDKTTHTNSQTSPHTQHMNGHLRDIATTKKRAAAGIKNHPPYTDIGVVCSTNQTPLQGFQYGPTGSSVRVYPYIHKTHQVCSGHYPWSCIASSSCVNRTHTSPIVSSQLNMALTPRGNSVNDRITPFAVDNQHEGQGYIPSGTFRHPSMFIQGSVQPRVALIPPSNSLNIQPRQHRFPFQQFNNPEYYIPTNLNDAVNLDGHVTEKSQSYSKNMASHSCSASFIQGPQISQRSKSHKRLQRVNDWLYNGTNYTPRAESEKCDPCNLTITGKLDTSTHTLQEVAKNMQAQSGRQTKPIGLFTGEPLPDTQQPSVKLKLPKKAGQQPDNARHNVQKHKCLNSTLSDSSMRSKSSYTSNSSEYVNTEAFVHSYLSDQQINKIGQKQLPMYKRSICDQAEENNKADEKNKADSVPGKSKDGQDSVFKLQTFNKHSDGCTQGDYDSIYTTSSNTESWENVNTKKNESVLNRHLENTKYKRIDNINSVHNTSSDIFPRQHISKHYKNIAIISGREENGSYQEQKVAMNRSDINREELRIPTVVEANSDTTNNCQKTGTLKLLVSDTMSEYTNTTRLAQNHKAPTKYTYTLASKGMSAPLMTSAIYSKGDRHSNFYESRGVPQAVARPANLQPNCQARTHSRQDENLNSHTPSSQNNIHSVTTPSSQGKESRVGRNLQNTCSSDNFKPVTRSSGEKQPQCRPHGLQNSSLPQKMQSSLETSTNQPNSLKQGTHMRASHPAFTSFSYSQLFDNQTCIPYHMTSGMSKLQQSSMSSTHLNDSNFRRIHNVELPTASQRVFSDETYLHVPCFQSTVTSSDAPVCPYRSLSSGATINLNEDPKLDKQQQTLKQMQQFQAPQYHPLQTHHQKLEQQIGKTTSTTNTGPSDCLLHPLTKDTTSQASASTDFNIYSFTADVQSPVFPVNSECHQKGDQIFDYTMDNYCVSQEITGLLPLDDNVQSMQSCSADSSMEQSNSLLLFDDIF